jgi:hypothetical protein
VILSNLDAALRGGWFGLVTQRFSWLEYRARQAVEDLNGLGLNYRLVAPPAEKSPAGKKPRETGLAEKKRAAKSG